MKQVNFEQQEVFLPSCWMYKPNVIQRLPVPAVNTQKSIKRTAVCWVIFLTFLPVKQNSCIHQVNLWKRFLPRRCCPIQLCVYLVGMSWNSSNPFPRNLGTDSCPFFFRFNHFLYPDMLFYFKMIGKGA